MPNAIPPPISEGDREATLRRLQEAFAEGHISHAEMDEHLQAVLTAKTPDDLVPVLSSLPDTNTGRTLILAGKRGRFRRSTSSCSFGSVGQGLRCPTMRSSTSTI